MAKNPVNRCMCDVCITDGTRNEHICCTNITHYLEYTEWGDSRSDTTTTGKPSDCVHIPGTIPMDFRSSEFRSLIRARCAPGPFPLSVRQRKCVLRSVFVAWPFSEFRGVGDGYGVFLVVSVPVGRLRRWRSLAASSRSVNFIVSRI